MSLWPLVLVISFILLMILVSLIFSNLSAYLLLATAIFLLLGASANVLVVRANGNRMPVAYDNEEYKEWLEKSGTHCPLTEETKLKLLADIIIVRINWAMSIGDCFLFASLIFLFVSVTLFAISFWRSVFKKNFRKE